MQITRKQNRWRFPTTEDMLSSIVTYSSFSESPNKARRFTEEEDLDGVISVNHFLLYCHWKPKLGHGVTTGNAAWAQCSAWEQALRSDHSPPKRAAGFVYIATYPTTPSV